MVPRFILIAALAGFSLTLEAGPVLDRVKAERTVRCGAVERPGIARVGEKGNWEGLAVDVCRAVAVAVLGSPDRVTFDDYETPAQFERIRQGQDDISFLTGSEIRFNQLAGFVLPGPTVYYESHGIIVPKSSKAQQIADLAGKRICIRTPSLVERSVSDFFERRHLTWLPQPFSEDGEMVDAFGAGHCDGMGYELTTLTGVPQQGQRLLRDATSTFPLMASTGTRDAEWAAIVAWTVDTLIAGERTETAWYAGGAGAMPVMAPELGLDPQWQNRVLASVGHYGMIYERNLGKSSGLQLARGPNADPTSGGLLLAPFLE